MLYSTQNYRIFLWKCCTSLIHQQLIVIEIVCSVHCDLNGFTRSTIPIVLSILLIPLPCWRFNHIQLCVALILCITICNLLPMCSNNPTTSPIGFLASVTVTDKMSIRYKLPHQCIWIWNRESRDSEESAHSHLFYGVKINNATKCKRTSFEISSLSGY